MPDWFGRRKAPEKTSPGGSVIHRYPMENWQPSRIGFTNPETAQFAEKRCETYNKLFGKVHDVSTETIPLSPHVEVRTYYRTGANGSRVCSLVTSGMSDLPMSIPAEAKVPRRVELIFYCSEPSGEYIDTLRGLAHFPHDQHTWIGTGHTIPNGNPPAPLFGSQILDTALFLPTVVAKDRAIFEQLTLDGDPVHLLWLVPLTTPECELKLKRGTNAILELFEQHQHPHVFDPRRASYV